MTKRIVELPDRTVNRPSTPFRAAAKEAFRLRRETILAEAARCFNRKSYHGTTMEDIARRLNVTKAALYYYVKNKEQILYECHRAVLDIAMEGMRLADQCAGTAEEKLRVALHHYIEGVASRLKGSVLLLHKEMLHPRLHQRVVRQRDEYEHWLRRVVADGVAKGTFGPRDAKLIVFLMLGAANWIPMWYSSEGERSPRDIADTFVDFFITGLVQGATPRATSRFPERDQGAKTFERQRLRQ